MNRKPSSSTELICQKELYAHATPFEKFVFRYRHLLAFGAFIVCFLAVILLHAPGHPRPLSMAIQTSRTIALAMFQYSNDHEDHYPDGESSTEVFQKLIDQSYITDPTLFYFPMPGKIPAPTKYLKPENVCFDVTGGLVSSDSDSLPLVFSTGYQVDYAPDGKARPLKNPSFEGVGIAVCYLSNSAKFVLAQAGTVPLINSNFDPKGKTYRQLTPDGVLPR